MPDSAENHSDQERDAAAAQTGAGETLAFEEAAERLETIVREMENGRLPLETLITRYEEGMKLVEFCNSSLAKAEKRIEIIQKTAQGTVELEAFDAQTTAAEASDSGEAPDAAGRGKKPRENRRKIAEPPAQNDLADDEAESSDDELSLF